MPKKKLVFCIAFLFLALGLPVFAEVDSDITDIVSDAAAVFELVRFLVITAVGFFLVLWMIGVLDPAKFGERETSDEDYEGNQEADLDYGSLRDYTTGEGDLKLYAVGDNFGDDSSYAREGTQDSDSARAQWAEFEAYQADREAREGTQDSDSARAQWAEFEGYEHTAGMDMDPEEDPSDGQAFDEVGFYRDASYEEIEVYESDRDAYLSERGYSVTVSEYEA